MVFNCFSVCDTLKMFKFARIVSIIKRLVHHGGYGNLHLPSRYNRLHLRGPVLKYDSD